MKYFKLFEQFIDEASGQLRPAENAGEWLKDEVGGKIAQEERNFESAVKAINRYNRYKRIKTISDMELVYQSNEMPTYQWDLPAERFDSSSPLFNSVLWDAYTLGRWNGRPAILFEKEKGLDYVFYVFAVPVE